MSTAHAGWLLILLGAAGLFTGGFITGAALTVLGALHFMRRILRV